MCGKCSECSERRQCRIVVTPSRSAMTPTRNEMPISAAAHPQVNVSLFTTGRMDPVQRKPFTGVASTPNYVAADFVNIPVPSAMAGGKQGPFAQVFRGGNGTDNKVFNQRPDLAPLRTRKKNYAQPSPVLNWAQKVF